MLLGTRPSQRLFLLRFFLLEAYYNKDYYDKLVRYQWVYL